MDFLDPSKKRAHTIKLFTGYFLVAVAILLATIILVYQANGYTFDRKTGSIVQNSLLFVDSQPVSASIYINDELQRSQTGARFELPTGEYTLRLAREGYRPWEHAFTLEGGTVEHFLYPRLYPEQLQTSQIAVYGAAPPFATQSPDRRWVVTQTPGSFVRFEVWDLQKPGEAPALLDVPQDLYTLPLAGKLELVEWSDDNKHFLAKHTVDTQTEFLIIHRQEPASSININRLLAFSPSRAVLRDKRADQLYLYEQNGGLVRTADLKNRTLSAPVLTDVLAFKSHGSDVILYMTAKDAPAGKVLAKLRSGDETIVLRDILLSADGKYFADVAKYEDHWYYAVASQAEDRVIIFRDPVVVENDETTAYVSPFSILRIARPEHVSFSANARFIGVQSNREFVVYDAERAQISRATVDVELGEDRRAVWMDGHRWILKGKEGVFVFDFDGTNLHRLVSAAPQLPVFFDRDYERMYTFNPSNLAPRYVFERTELLVEPR